MTATSHERATDAPIRWDEIRPEWRRRKYVAASREVQRLVGTPIRDGLHALLFAETQPNDDVGRHALEEAFAYAAKEPEGALLTALYVYGLCLQKWEQSEDYERPRRVLRLLDEVTKPITEGEDVPARLLSILVRQAALLDDAMGVENAMSCSCPLEMGGLANRIVGELADLAGEERNLGAGFDEVRDVMRADAATTSVYFETIAKVASAVLEFVVSEIPAWASFDGTLQEIEAAQRNELAGDVYDSELRAHAASLAALGEHAGEPRLRVDAAKLVYLYPFTLQFPYTLKGMGAEETVQSAKDKVVEYALEEAGFKDASTRVREVDDIWDREGRAEPGYAGVSIALPSITVVSTADAWLEDDRDKAEAKVTFNVEVRLSRLGNHHLRITSGLEDADLHDVNQALRRGTHAMGAERLSSGDHEDRWETIEEYADEVIFTIAKAVEAKAVTNPNARSHVVLAARAISVLEPGGGTSNATLDTLESSVGATLLFHPVRRLSSSLEEWVRYPPPSIHNVLGAGGYVGDLVVRTHNTTILYMPSSPEWLVKEYEEMVEFVASVPSLLTLWGDHARQEATCVDTRLRRDVVPKLESEMRHLQTTEDTPEVGADEECPPDGDDPIGSLYKQQMEIRALESDIRARLAFLLSPELCKTRAQRRFLDSLWQAAGLRVLEKELDRQLTLLADQHERVRAMVVSIDDHYKREQQKRAERLELPAKIAAAVLTAAALLGVIQWVEGEVGDPSLATAIESVAFLTAALVLLWFVWVQGRR
jgi:hypothetical protein